MFSTTTGTGRKPVSGTDNESTVENCRLCCSDFEQKDGLSNNQKLIDPFCKYLHSSLTQELSIGSADRPLCPRCSVTGMEIIALSDQMDSIQKSLSELVFMFSLEILHRRGKTVESHGMPAGKKLIEFDVSSLPNFECWNSPSPTIDTASPSENLQNIIQENIFVENADDQILLPNFAEPQSSYDDISIGEIKLEKTIDYGLEYGNEEVSEEIRSTNHNTIDLTESELLTSKTEVLITLEDAVEHSESITPSPGHDQQMTPILKLQKLEIRSGGKELIAEGTMNCMQGFNNDNNQRRKSEKTVWTKMDFGGSFRLRQQNSEPLNNQRDEQLNLLPLHRLSTEESKSSEESKSASSFQNRRCKITANTNTGDLSKEKPYKRRFDKKSFKKQTEKIPQNSQKLCHLAKKPTFSAMRQSLSDDKNRRQRDGNSNNWKGRKFQCTFCPKRCDSNWKLVCHVRTHTGERPFRCDKCDYAAAELGTLKDHKITVHGLLASNRSLECTFCLKRFHKNSLLVRHVRIHTGEKPFRCDQCDYAAGQLSTIQDHKLIKHGLLAINQSKFECSFCPRLSPSNSRLVHHVRTHTKEKPFRCDKCDYSSARPYNLKAHQRSRHLNPRLNFQCGECGDKFKLAVDVKQHFKRIHTTLQFSDDCVIAAE